MNELNVYTADGADGTPYYFSPDVMLVVNGHQVKVNVNTGTRIGSYYYFDVGTVDVYDGVTVLGIDAPVAGKTPTTADRTLCLNSAHTEALPLYVSRLTWFIDADGDNVCDEGEEALVWYDAEGNYDAATSGLNEDGTFKYNTTYKVSLSVALDEGATGRLAPSYTFKTSVYTGTVYQDAIMHYDTSGAPTDAVYAYPKSTVPSQDSTCTEKGWDEHKKCDDCGQLFDTSDVEIDEVPFLNLADHTGGTATCTTKAVCSVCHQPYGNYANHSYTAETKKQEALKTAGNCRDKAVYYYSCSECGNVEHNDAHTFEGDKDANTHVGGTSTVNASEPDHKNQVDGYTGDTKCLGCGEIIATGTSIPAGAHTPSSTWNSDGTYHWKECTTVGCGVVIDGSKAKHSSTGANVATCQHKAVCDVCNVEYGELAAHNPASGWTSDASGHWHACQTAGCTEKCDFATHTPDHQGHATEEYAIKCTECGYVIEAQLSHTHDVDTTKYESDETNHWNTCSGCGEKQNVSAHEFEWKIDKEATATEKGSKHEECKVCGYKKAAVEIPATGTPTDPTPENPDSPPTGDNSMMALWIAVLFVSGFGVVTTAVYGKKRHSVK